MQVSTSLVSRAVMTPFFVVIIIVINFELCIVLLIIIFGGLAPVKEGASLASSAATGDARSLLMTVVVGSRESLRG